MPLTADTLPRHELIGLVARVSAASDSGRRGIEGRVVNETTNTMSIERGCRTWQVPKATVTFEFELPEDDATDCEYVTVEGDRLVGHPARRTEQRGDSTWR